MQVVGGKLAPTAEKDGTLFSQVFAHSPNEVRQVPADSERKDHSFFSPGQSLEQVSYIGKNLFVFLVDGNARPVVAQRVNLVDTEFDL